MAFEPPEVSAWRQSLQDYSRGKREPNPDFYHSQHYMKPLTHFEVKHKEYAFDPVLNRYRTAEQDKGYSQTIMPRPKAGQSGSTQCPYDIITLRNAPDELPTRSKTHSVDSHAQPYNIITNQVHIPGHKAFRVRLKKINEEVFRDYNIINNQYWKNHQEKAGRDTDKVQEELAKKYQKTHDFDPIRCNYYDKEKEDKFWEEEQRKARALSELKNSKLPRSYKFREPINLNHEKAGFVSEGFEAFKCREKAKMKRFQLRYDMEDRFRKEGMAADDRADAQKLQKFYARRFVEEYKEGVDPITLEPTDKAAATLPFALGNKRDFVTEKPRPKKRFRFLY